MKMTPHSRFAFPLCALLMALFAASPGCGSLSIDDLIIDDDAEAGDVTGDDAPDSGDDGDAPDARDGDRDDAGDAGDGGDGPGPTDAADGSDNGDAGDAGDPDDAPDVGDAADSDTTVCTPNGCGGCTPLPNLGAPCGCGDDEVVCDGTDAARCSDTTRGTEPPPAAPGDVQASDGDHEGFVRVTWRSVRTAERYRVYRDGVLVDELEAEVDGTAVTTFDDEDAAAPPRPTAVTDLVAEDDEAGVRLTWTASRALDGAASSYEVRAWTTAGCESASSEAAVNEGFRRRVPVGHYELRTGTGEWIRLEGSDATTDEWLAGEGLATRPRVVVGAAAATTDDAGVRLVATGFRVQETPSPFAVRAVSAAGAGDLGNEATATWLAGALAYSWSRRAADGDTYASTGLGGESAVDATVVGDPASYVYRVDVTAGAATTASATTDPVRGPQVPPAPLSVTASTNRETDVTLTWAAAASATRYDVQIGDGSWTDVGATNSYVDTAAPAGSIAGCATMSASDGAFDDRVTLACEGEASVAAGASRTYRVRGVNAAGAGAASADATGSRAGGALRFQWQRSSGDAASGFSDLAGAAGSDGGAAAADDTVAFNTGRHYRLNLSGGAGVATVTRGPDRGYRGAAPTIVTAEASSVGATSATLAGTATSLGGASSLTAAGFCWRATDTATDCAGSSAGSPCGEGWTNETASSVSTSFTGELTRLRPATTYRYCAYASNGLAAAGYGAPVTFTTQTTPAPGVPVVTATTNRAADVRVSWDDVLLALSYDIRIDGGAWITGVTSPYTDAAALPGTITGCTVSASVGTSTTQVDVACSGAAVSSGATRTYEVRAVGVAGSGPASAPATGRRSGGTLAYAWERSSGDAASGFAAWTGAPTTATGADDTVPFDTGRYYRVRLTAGTGVSAVTTGAARGLRGVPPTVRTEAATDVRGTTATLLGVVTGLGGAASVTSAGFCYRVSSTATECAGVSEATPCAAGWTSLAAVAPDETSGAFSAEATGLRPASSWRVCAWASNSRGVSHGEATSFNTTAAQLGEACSNDADCGEGRCAGDASDPDNHRCVPVEVTTAAGGTMEFRYVPAPPASGFTMGAPAGEVGSVDGDEAQHNVALTRELYVGRTEVTQGQWLVAGGASPAQYNACGYSCPVENLDAYAAAAYANWLSERAGLERCYTFSPTNWDRTVSNWADGDHDAGGTTMTAMTSSGATCKGYRLPTEAEWEWLARGGTTTATYQGDLQSPFNYDPQPNLEPAAWYGYNAVASYAGCMSITLSGRTQCVGPQPVGNRLANAYGLRDVLGNVWEWTSDAYVTAHPAGIDPSVAGASPKTLRGGSFSNFAGLCRAASRFSYDAFQRSGSVGFRLVRSVAGARELPLGALCESHDACASGACSTEATDPSNRRCAPAAVLRDAPGGAMGFVYIPATPSAGFNQGSSTAESGREADETRWVSILSRPYYLGRTEVTQGQWKAATGGTNPACFQSATGTSCTTANANDSGPVENVNWWGAAAYANWLSENDGDASTTPCYAFTPGDWDRTVANWANGNTAATDVVWRDVACGGYRLPTESEWEWAARGAVDSGTLYTTYYWGSTILGSYLWYASNASGRSQSVGIKTPNAYGLRDMSGNVWERLWDWYGAYPTTGRTDYTGPASGTLRTTRGGSWADGAAFQRSADRGSDTQGAVSRIMGFRLARNLP